jgi:hypothetical protein
MKLYEIADNYRQTLDALVNEETGELDEQALVALNGITATLEEKGVAVASYIRNIEADRKALDDERKRLAKRQEQLEARIEWMKGYLQQNMEACGIKEISCPYFSVKLKKCPPSVHLTDEDSVPETYRKRKETVTIDRVKIKQDIQAGFAIAGAELRQGNTIQIK